MKSRLLCLLCVLFCLFCLPWPALAQTDTTTLVVTLFDKADQPLVEAEITLILIRYGELAVESEAIAICKTDKAGQCTFEVSNPPRLADGSAEAYLDVAGIGRRWISWQGEQVAVTLKVSDLELQATVGVPNEQGYEYETPGAYNSPPYTPAPTVTPAYTETPTLQPTLPGELPETQSPLQEPAAAPYRGVSILPLACALVLFALIGGLFWRSYQRQRGGKA